jgi:hypothetical protein
MQREGRKLATPSPVPSRLKKAPGRATLSPKGRGHKLHEANVGTHCGLARTP